jgi:hypothetical protein
MFSINRKAGSFMAEIAKLIEVRGIEYAPIKFEIADDLSYCSAEIPGKVLAKAEALFDFHRRCYIA